MLAVRVIDCHHREFEHAVRRHRLETDNAASRFLAAAPDFLRQLRTLFVNAADQIGAVIDDDVRLVFQRHLDVTGVFLRCGRVIRVYPQTVLRQRRRDLVLRAEWIGAGDGHLRAACRQHLAQIGGLGFQMHRQCDLETGKRLLARKIAANVAQNRHMCFYPADLPLSGFRKVQIFDRAHRATSR